MARRTSDHIPCKIHIGTSIPMAQIFRFENIWLEHQGFYDLVKSVWSTNISNNATRITAKFKLLRAALKKWSKSLSNLKRLIKNCNSTLKVLDSLEGQRALFVQEYNFKKILKNHILMLLKHQKEYWKISIANQLCICIQTFAMFMLGAK
jgi:hypothetical protein